MLKLALALDETSQPSDEVDCARILSHGISLQVAREFVCLIPLCSPSRADKTQRGSRESMQRIELDLFAALSAASQTTLLSEQIFESVVSQVTILD